MVLQSQCLSVGLFRVFMVLPSQRLSVGLFRVSVVRCAMRTRRVCCVRGAAKGSRGSPGAAAVLQSVLRAPLVSNSNGPTALIHTLTSGANFLKNEQSELLSTQKLDRVCCQ